MSALKKLTLFCLFFVAACAVNAQIIFSEDFQSGMPSSFTLVNQDGRTPASGVGYVTDAWVIRADLEDNSDSIAVSTSWYDPAGAADDWMITPMIHIDSQSILMWTAKAQDADFPDGYQVRISTTDTARASFLANFALFNINGEQPTWITRSVDLAAAGYANQDVYFAFRNISNDMFLLKVDDIVVRNPFQVDAKAVSFEVPRSGCQLGSAEPISITIENYGATALSNFDVTYIVNDGNAPVTVTETVSDSIAPASTYTYTFTQTADLSVSGTAYDINAFVSAAGDADLSNDTLDAVTVVNVTPANLTTPYTTSFETAGEILGWSAEDANNDGFPWFLGSGDANTGNIFFAYQYNTDAITAADDWLFSTCMDLIADTTYELRFFYSVGASGGTVYPEKLKVSIGNSASAAGMTTILEDLGAQSNDFFQEHKIVFEVASSGTYYIGFHCYSDADAFFLKVDDVTVGELQPPVAGFTTGKNELEVTFSSTSTGADSIYWDFGDGSNASTSPVVHNYTAPGSYYACITAFNQAGSNTFCDSVSVDTTTGITFFDVAGFSVFPNPTNGTAVVELKGQINEKTEITVSDMLGKELLAVPVKDAQTRLDLAGKPEGIYFITLSSGNSRLKEKLVLAR